MNTLLKSLTLATFLLAASVMAQTPYDEGQKALREQRWMDAASEFELAIKEDKEQADAAMYWRAHALYRAGRKNEAGRQIRKLESQYPDSQWVKEARVLQIEYQDSAEMMAQDVSGDSGLDDELRLFALAQLMERNPERVLPLVLDMVRNSESQAVREDALFVLGMSEDPAAMEAIASIARDSGNPELQVHAIHILGTASSDSSLPLLSSLYSESSDIEVKSAVIQAFSMAGDSEKLKQILATESDPELRQAALFGIATQDDENSAELIASMYDGAASVEEKSMILQTLMVMDNATELAMKILRDEQDPGLQVQAIQVLGMVDATEELNGLYSSLDNPDTRMAVLQSMAIAGDTAGLIAILEAEKDPELRAAAIQSLGMSDDTAASEYLVSLYPDGNREEKRAVIQSMMIMDDGESLLQLLKQENDPMLKREIMQMLAVMGSEESDEQLLEMLEAEG